MDFGLFDYAIFFVAAFCAGLVDSIAGGGGLISVPTLMAMGVPVHMVLATNKLQSSFGSFSAAFNFWRKGLVSLQEIWLGIVFVFVGACLGTYVILLLQANLLRLLIPIFLGVIFLYTLFSPKIGEQERPPKLKPALFYGVFGFILGFYDGFFGPGTGSFWTFLMLALLGLPMKKAVAHTKVLNFTSNIVSLSVFIWGSPILWGVGLLMGLGQMLGAFVGSHLVMVKEVKFIRTIFLGVVGVTILKLLWDYVVKI
ncbi:TSUP family transporter [Helicobacter bizzozeronii]|uniref:Probable membrane transporter protein n=2 Tax=Helicobacter bizzozeronii TaxID=56877 RepID=F8KQF6_HELBC|nr:TSUP family transporter [Helicobacter bizzozeronii]CCB80638.1 putative membrane protein YfcA [Helicobacter bizzozeronii CIII-1]